MLIANHKPIVLIGYPESTFTQEAEHFISAEHTGTVKILTPEEFLTIYNRTDYQYIVAFSLDVNLRAQIIELLEQENLDCIRYIHNTVVYYNSNIESWLGRGSFISPFSTVLLNANIGNHCVIETYCLISHYVDLCNNVILHSGVMIAGKTVVGENSVFNFKSATLNALNICGNVEIGATSVVTKNIDQPGYYVGSVARRVGDRKIFKDG